MVDICQVPTYGGIHLHISKRIGGSKQYTSVSPRCTSVTLVSGVSLLFDDFVCLVNCKIGYLATVAEHTLERQETEDVRTRRLPGQGVSGQTAGGSGEETGNPNGPTSSQPGTVGLTLPPAASGSNHHSLADLHRIRIRSSAFSPASLHKANFQHTQKSRGPTINHHKGKEAASCYSISRIVTDQPFPSFFPSFLPSRRGKNVFVRACGMFAPSQLTHQLREPSLRPSSRRKPRRSDGTRSASRWQGRRV